MSLQVGQGVFATWGLWFIDLHRLCGVRVRVCICTCDLNRLCGRVCLGICRIHFKLR